MKKEEIQKLASQCMFEFNDDEIEYVNASFDTLKKQNLVLNEIDTAGIEPMIYPFEQPVFYLRDDKKSREISKEEVLKNATQKNEDFIKVTTKVVK